MQTSEDKKSVAREGRGEHEFGSRPPERRERLPALKIVLTYAGVSALWILFSDRVVAWLIHDPVAAANANTIKGWLFVAVTASMLWFLMQRLLNQLQHSEAVLRESERNYREVFNATADAIFLHDGATGRVLSVNQAMLRMYGFSSEQEVLGLNADVLSADEPEFSRAEAENRVRRAPRESQQMFEWRAKRKNGEVFWVEVTLRGSRIGERDCVLAVVRDITERKRNEEQLRQFRFSIEQASDAVFWMNREAGFTYVNDQACRSLGYTREELLKLSLWSIDPVHSKERWNSDSAGVPKGTERGIAPVRDHAPSQERHHLSRRGVRQTHLVWRNGTARGVRARHYRAPAHRGGATAAGNGGGAGCRSHRDHQRQGYHFLREPRV